MSYDALILDNDGVLITPTRQAVWRSVNWLAFKDHDIEPDRRHADGLDQLDREDIERIATAYGIDPDSFWRSRERHAVREQRAAIRAGAKRRYPDVNTLPFEYDLGIVSNNQHETVEFIVKHLDLADRVDTYYGREANLDGFARKKPDPYYLERAMDDLNATNPLFVGDSNADIGAAKAAGVDSAFLRRDHRHEYELTFEPTYEIASLNELSTLFDPSVEPASLTPSAENVRSK